MNLDRPKGDNTLDSANRLASNTQTEWNFKMETIPFFRLPSIPNYTEYRCVSYRS